MGGGLGKYGERYGGCRKVCWVWGEVRRDVEKGIVWGVRGKVRVDVGGVKKWEERCGRVYGVSVQGMGQ